MCNERNASHESSKGSKTIRNVIKNRKEEEEEKEGGDPKIKSRIVILTKR